MNKQPIKPEWIGTLLDPNFKYNPSAKTDVQATWRKYGWTPPSEAKQNESNTGIQLP